jgi:hypothetical protein
MLPETPAATRTFPSRATLRTPRTQVPWRAPRPRRHRSSSRRGPYIPQPINHASRATAPAAGRAPSQASLCRVSPTAPGAVIARCTISRGGLGQLVEDPHEPRVLVAATHCPGVGAHLRVDDDYSRAERTRRATRRASRAGRLPLRHRSLRVGGQRARGTSPHHDRHPTAAAITSAPVWSALMGDLEVESRGGGVAC